jgi:flagellar basal-body rod modification protein FlgD
MSTTATNPLSQMAGYNGTSASSSSSASSASSSTSAASGGSIANSFLTMLVAQMQNQDPLNPMDNSQITSQMAQISTVTGLQTLNTSISSLGNQMVQSQAMQGAALVGHDVVVQGNNLRVNSTTGVGDGGVELSAAADSVKVNITTAAGTVVGSVDLGAQAAGEHDFTWAVPSAYQSTPLQFTVTATSGTNAVQAMTLEHQQISAVSNFNNTLALQLSDGESVGYDAVWAFR